MHMTENSHFYKQNDNMPHKKEKQRKCFGIWFLGSKITADGDCSHEIKRCLLLGRKAMTHLDSILIFIGRTAAEAETPILWPPDAKSWLIGKDPDAGKDWGQEEKGRTEDEMVGWYHRLNGYEFEQTLGDSEGQGRLVWCSWWGCKQLDTTEQHWITTIWCIKNQRHCFPYKGSFSQSYGFSRSHIQMWGLDHKEGWVPKNWWWIVMLEKTLESPLDGKEIQPVNFKENQLWIFIERTDAETPILWPSYANNWFIGKNPDAGKDWRQKEKRVAVNEMVR